MSFQNKGFWISKGAGHLMDGDAGYDNPSRIEPKRSHQWFMDSTEPELFPNKKQALQSPNTKSTPGILNPNVPPPWDNNPSSFQSVPNNLMDRLFGSETTRPINFMERNIPLVGTDNSVIRRKGIDEQFGHDPSVGLSISHSMEDHETCLNYGGIRKVKVNQVNDNNFISMGHNYDKEDDTITLMGGPTYIRSMASTYDKGEEDTMAMGPTYGKEDMHTISFGSYNDDNDLNHLASHSHGYDLLYSQSPIQTLETQGEKELDAANANSMSVSLVQVAKPKLESVSKKSSEIRMAKKEAPNSFPSNVRSLISTGMLDGVPVKYVSLSREELRGTIKGAGYLCGCQSCNFSKVLNAYEFERHAGCKTKHPNNHIYFANGKTIYGIVQELRSMPESKLFDAIQTVTGSPINQKSFRVWKESFQAATRELQRIYGKEELNL